MLIVGIQTSIKNKYAGLIIACVFIFLSSSNLGKLLGIVHPLLRYANTFSIPFADMNGFGNYVTAFHWKMLLWSSLAICVLLIRIFFWSRSTSKISFIQSLV